jgi:DNA-binding SARP family transcriptional activator
MAVRVGLLGGFTVEVDGVALPADAWSRRQAAALVKLLALTPGRELHREQVIDALWPDLGLDEAAPRLHKAAHFARKALGAPTSVVLRGDVVALWPDGDLVVDAFVFDAIAEDALDKGSVDAAASAVAAYTGDLLPHDLYEPWTENVRDRLRLRHLQLLRQAERWEDLLEIDPADEEAHLALMGAQAGAGDRRAALLQYERMERALERELGVEPSPAARALRDELLAARPDAVAAATPPSVPGPDAQVAVSASPEGTVSPFVSIAVPAEDDWPMIGRGAELERIASRFVDPERGGVLLHGGAGIGKTRLADECLRSATAAGLATERVAGNPAGREITLGGLAHLLPPDIVTAAGTGGGELDRTALFHRARGAVTQAVPAGQRLLLVVDDIDQLDDLSRSLVASLIVDRAVFAVVTLRSGNALEASIEHLVKDGHLERLHVAELDPDAAEALLHRALGAPMLRTSLRQLVDGSLGNPGILRQLVETAREAGHLELVHGVWQLTGPLETSPTLEGLVAQRIEGLEGEARHALDLLAVAGELGLQLLSDLVGEDAVESVERRGVLAVRQDGRRTRVGLAHPLYGEVLRGGLTTIAGRRLRRELADALEARGARRIDDRFRMVAWRLEGGGHVDPDLLLDAAQLALVDGRPEIAERLLAQLGDRDLPPEAVQLLAELHFRRNDSERVEELLGSIDPATVSEVQRAQIARRRALNLFYRTTDHLGPAELLRSALAGLTDPDVRRGLEATLAMMLANGGEVGRATELAETALPDAAGPVRVELLRVLGLIATFAGRSEDAIRWAEEGQALRTGLDAELALPGRTMLLFAEIVARTEHGQVDEARRVAEHARRQNHPGTVGWLDTAQARLELLAGRPRSAKRVVLARLNEARVRGRGATERWVLALHACGSLLEGRVEEAGSALERVAELEDETRALMHLDIDRAHGWRAAAAGRLGDARSKLLGAADEARDRGAPGIEAIMLHDLARFGVDEVLERLLAVCESTQGDLSAARALHVRGRIDGDGDLLDAAAALLADGGVDLLAAEVAAEAATVHGARGRSAEAELAAALAEELRTRSGIRLVTPALP